jgi:hypothetical protein
VVINQRIRKSEKLTPEVFKAFKKWVRSKETKIDAYEKLAISQPTLDRVIEKGKCHGSVAIKIKATLVEAGLIAKEDNNE